MKKLLYCLLVLLAGVSCARQTGDSYQIEGEIVGVQSGKVYLQKAVNGSLQSIKSCELKNGRFVFTGRQKLPEVYYLNLNGKSCVAQFFVENSQIKIKSYPDNIDQEEVEGSESNNLFSTFKGGVKEHENKIDKLGQDIAILSMTGQQDKLNAEMKELNTANTDLKDYIVHFVQSHPESAVAPFVVLWKLLPMVEVRELEQITRQLSPALKGSSYVSQINQIIRQQKILDIGRLAPDFVLKDQNNQRRRLSDYRGNQVLLLFWASWDSAGKSLLAQLHSLYPHYHSRKFEVITVALDRSREDWMHYLSKNSESWVSVCDVKGKGGSVSKIYQVKDLPCNYLIGPDGKIEKRNVDLNTLPRILSSY